MSLYSMTVRLAVRLQSKLGAKLDIPIDLVAAPEGEVRHQRPRAAFTLANCVATNTRRGRRQVSILGLSSSAAIGRGIHAGHVGDVVAVLLQPLDRRVLVAEEVILRAAARAVDFMAIGRL